MKTMTLFSEIGNLINRISFIFPLLAVLSLFYWVFDWGRYVKAARRKIKHLSTKGRILGGRKDAFKEKMTNKSTKYSEGDDA